jgi:hypothetical protein
MEATELTETLTNQPERNFNVTISFSFEINIAPVPAARAIEAP